jgi:Protein of unknown function with PCYCGC motif
MNRRELISRGVAAAAALVALPHAAWAGAASHVPAHWPRALGPHPKPRPGITAAKMMTPAQLERRNDVADAFEGVRAIPEVIDGLRCHCGCAEIPGFYSLLSCYEGTDAMALICPICQGEGRMAARLHKEGSTLDEIRAALDAKYG